MKSFHRFAVVLIAAFSVCLNTPVAKGDTSGASDYIQDLGNQALSVITNKANSKTQKQDKLSKLFSDNVDFQWVGRFVMGRYWREATADQKTLYVAAYEKFLILHYIASFTDYSSGAFTLQGEKEDGNGEYTIATQLSGGDASSEPVEVDYRVRREEAQNAQPPFKIFDVIVEGVSLLNTQRSEFSDVIANNNIDYLIHQLDAHSADGSSL